jgi:hypothetical protein
MVALFFTYYPKVKHIYFRTGFGPYIKLYSVRRVPLLLVIHLHWQLVSYAEVVAVGC